MPFANARRCAFAGALLTAAVAVPTGIHAMSLKDALTMVYQTNPNLEGQRTSVMRTDEEVSKALSGWRPRLTGEYAKTGARLDQNYPTGIERRNTAWPDAFSLKLVQPVYAGGRTVAATREAEFNVQNQRARLAEAEQSLLLDTVRAYVSVVVGEDILELNDNNVKILTEVIRITRERVRLGDATRTDIALAESRLARAITERATVVNKVKAVRAAFESVVGVAPGKLVMPPMATIGPNSLEELRASARQYNPSIAGTTAQERAAAENVAYTIGDMLPKVNLRFSAGRDLDTMLNERRRDEFVAALVVEVPLYQGGAEHARVRQSKLAENQRRIETQVNNRQLENEIVSTWAEFEMLTNQLPLYDQQIMSAELALEGATRELSAGSRTVSDILIAEQDLLNARVGKSQAIGDLVSASYKILSIAGLLSAASLELPVQIYNPETNYNRARNAWFGLSVEAPKPSNTQNTSSERR